MGYRPKRSQIHLKFAEDDHLHGLEISMEGLFYDEVQPMLVADEILDEDFIKHVKEWNLEDPETGEPLPLEAKSLLRLEVRDIRRLKLAWFNTVIGRTSDFLEKKSNDGDLSGVESLPMESL